MQILPPSSPPRKSFFPIINIGSLWPTCRGILMSSDGRAENRFSDFIDKLSLKIGSIVSYIWLVLLCVIVTNVILRYVFSEGRIELEELQWHLYSIGFLFGLSFALTTDSHIRVDILHEKFSPELRAWIELYGILLFLMPFCALIVMFGLPFVMSSYEVGEVSASPGGLPLRWLIKASLPVAFLLLAVTAVARLLRTWSFLFNNARINK
ncbi:MAG: C4-dicarboxylate ABC transporter permease [Gammaproteobacteria bacterium]|nr:C4-dicarboxylate ABC transporter permease [Gammaproteobacteria bacterium]